MTQKAYSKIETGETKLTVYHLIQIGEILEVGINELINPEISAVYHGHHTDTRKGIAMTKKPNDDLIELYENQIANEDREIDMLHKYIARLEKGGASVVEESLVNLCARFAKSAFSLLKVSHTRPEMFSFKIGPENRQKEEFSIG